MEELAALFDPPAEVVADFSRVRDRADCSADAGEVLGMLQRRPCTAADVADGMGMHLAEALKHLENLVADGRAERSGAAGKSYYKSR
jgi:predicted ArsR family transcriptional regulator